MKKFEKKVSCRDLFKNNYFPKVKKFTTLALNGVQDSITIYPPTTSGKSFVIYTKSEMITSCEALGLKEGDRIAVSFGCSDADEAIGMVNSLFKQNVIVKAIIDLPLQQYIDGKIVENKIKTIDAYTVNSSDDDENIEDVEEEDKKKKSCKRRK